ncbi:WS/DGAT domain-containing protein [Mycolicibacterium sp. XJ1819]
MLLGRLSMVDAQMFWMSVKIPNDQFLLYGFAGAPDDVEMSVEVIRRRAEVCADLRLRVCDHGGLSHPRWVDAPVQSGQFVVHELADISWRGCLAAVAELAEHQLDACAMTWRLHVFSGVTGMPGAEIATVAVVQMAHALGDGQRSAALAAALFGRRGAVPTAPPRARFEALALPWLGYRAAQAHRRLVRDTEAGTVPPPATSRPPLRTNAQPEGVRAIRTVVVNRSRIAGPTVTVGALAAVSTALSRHLRELGEDPATLGAEVPMAKVGVRQAYNQFGNVGVGLYPQLDFGDRVARIEEEFAQRRRRAAHPAMAAAARASAAAPAPLVRWGVGKFDVSRRSPTVTGNTVVSSVNRGPADLRFGEAPVVLTAGYPALSPMMGTTHGVHGIGETVAVSVHAAQSAIGDIDAYAERLAAALAEHSGVG